jgi:hypothetical protein
MYAELRVGNLKHSQSLAKEISPTGEGVNHIVKRGEVQIVSAKQFGADPSFGGQAIQSQPEADQPLAELLHATFKSFQSFADSKNGNL